MLHEPIPHAIMMVKNMRRSLEHDMQKYLQADVFMGGEKDYIVRISPIRHNSPSTWYLKSISVVVT